MPTNGRLSKAEERMAEKLQARGFKLQCPVCGEPEAEITLNLQDVSSRNCAACGNDFAVTTAVKLIGDRLAAWKQVERWVALAGDVKAAAEAEPVAPSVS